MNIRTILLPLLVLAGIEREHAFSQAPAWQWAKSFGGADFDALDDIACDAVGHVYAAGYFYLTVDFDPGPGTSNLTSMGGSAFVSKLTETGNLVWAKAFGGTTVNDYAECFAIALNNNGNGEVYTTGYFGGTVDFDPGAGVFNLTSANTDIFVCKLDSSGNFIWAKAFLNIFIGTTAYGITLALDPSGNGDVYTAGNFNGLVDFDPGPGSYNLGASPANFTDMFISKLNGAGDFMWAGRMGGPQNDLVRQILVDPSGNGRIYTTGYFASTADFAPGPATVNITAAGDWDAYFCTLDTSGSLLWAKAVSGTGRELGMSLALDLTGSGSIFATGSFDGTADFDPSPTGVYNLTPSLFDVFVLKLDSSGNFLWAKSMGGAGNDEAFTIKLDPQGNGVYTTGFFEMTCDFDPGPVAYNLTEAGGGDIFISRLDSSGNFAWAKGMGGSGSDYGDCLAISASGEVFLSGMFESSSVAFDSTNLANTTIGFDDLFIAKLDTMVISGIIPVLDKSCISIFPNPVKDELTVRSDLQDGIVRLELYDLHGRILDQKECGKIGAEEKLNLSNVADGIYFLKVYTSHSIQSVRLVKAGNR